MRPDRLTQAFVEGLTHHIRSSGFSGHERLEGQKELGERFGVSYTTVRRGLSLLTAQKLIYRVKGKGIFVAPREHLSIRNWVVAILRRYGQAVYHETWSRTLLALRGELMARGHGLMVFGDQDGFVDLRKMCYEDQVRGVVFIDPAETPSMKEIAKFLERRRVASVRLEEKPGATNRNTVSFDHHQAGAQCAAHLIERGRRRIALFADQTDGCFALRVRGFQGACRGPGVDGKLVRWHPQTLVDEATLRGLDGVALIHEGLAFPMLRLCAHHGLSVPRDLALIAVDGSPVCGRFDPALSSVTLPLDALAALTTAMLFDLMGDPGKKFPIARVEPFVERRKSS